MSVVDRLDSVGLRASGDFGFAGRSHGPHRDPTMAPTGTPVDHPGRRGAGPHRGGRPCSSTSSSRQPTTVGARPA